VSATGDARTSGQHAAGATNPGAATPSLDAERLAGLVFELAAQLHAERLHRLALEHALVAAGVLPDAALQDSAADPALRERSRREVEASVARLMRVITESADPRAPLRGPNGGT
jgi:hypothetical protein